MLLIPPTTDYQDQKISFWASNYVYKLESGEVVVIFDDITKNIVNEQELNKFKRLFDTSLFGYAIADSSRNLSYLNNYFAQSHGYQSEELTGQPISILHSEDQFVEVAKIIDEFLETGNFGPTNIHHIHKNVLSNTLILLLRNSQVTPGRKPLEINQGS